MDGYPDGLPHDPVRYAQRYGSAPGHQAGPQCPMCASPLPGPRARFCSSACRQRAYRRRSLAPPPLPRRLPREVIVYQCPECEERYLGEQHCGSCNLWCRRLGPGGECPHCDQPVSITDLMSS